MPVQPYRFRALPRDSCNLVQSGVRHHKLSSEDEDATTSVKKIKNGATVTLRADTKVGSAYEWDCLCITYMNTKTKGLTRREIYVK